MNTAEFRSDESIRVNEVSSRVSLGRNHKCTRDDDRDENRRR